MKQWKRILSLTLAIITLLSVSIVSVSAQTTWLYTNSSYDNQYCTCTLSKPKKTDAKVTVSVVCTSPVSIKMTDEKNRTIWSENNAIAVKKSLFGCQGSRTFNLGKDHSVYRLFFKSKNSASVQVKSPKNCTIK